MKKKLCLCIATLLLLSLCACSKEQTTSGSVVSDDFVLLDVGDMVVQTTTTAENGSTPSTTSPIKDLYSKKDEETGYIRPVYAVQLDLTLDDPSNEQMKFNFDAEGKIVSCRYTVNGVEMSALYSYEHDMVRIRGFCGSEEMVDIEEAFCGPYSANVGFSKFKGFYLKGFIR